MPRSPRLSILALEARDVPTVITDPLFLGTPAVPPPSAARVATPDTASLELTASATSVGFGDTVTLTAATGFDDTLPAGTVTFKDGPLTLGTAQTGVDGATFTWRANRVGDHTFTAVLTRGSTRLAAEPLTVTVEQGELTGETVVATPAAPASGSWMRLRFDYTTTADARDVIGSVTFKDNGTVIGNAPVRPGRPVELAFNAPAPGQHEFTAEYSGNANMMSSTTEPLTVTIGPRIAAATRTTLTTAARPVTGQPIQLLAEVRRTNGARVTGGTVTFRADGPEGAILGTAAVANGQARFAYTQESLGPRAITTFFAHYEGTATLMTSDSATLTVSPRLDTRLRLTVGTAVAGRPVALFARLTVPTPGASDPTGTVTFRDGTRVLGTVPVDANGTAMLSATGLAQGVHALSASYDGDADYYGAASPALSVVFKKASSVSLAVVGTPLTAGRPLNLRVTVTGAPRPTGLVTFRDGSTFLGVVRLDANGRASLALSRGLSRGAHALTATYSGDIVLGPSIGSATATLA